MMVSKHDRSREDTTSDGSCAYTIRHAGNAQCMPATKECAAKTYMHKTVSIRMVNTWSIRMVNTHGQHTWSTHLPIAQHGPEQAVNLTRPQQQSPGHRITLQRPPQRRTLLLQRRQEHRRCVAAQGSVGGAQQLCEGDCTEALEAGAAAVCSRRVSKDIVGHRKHNAWEEAITGEGCSTP